LLGAGSNRGSGAAFFARTFSRTRSHALHVSVGPIIAFRPVHFCTGSGCTAAALAEGLGLGSALGLGDLDKSAIAELTFAGRSSWHPSQMPPSRACRWISAQCGKTGRGDNPFAH